jgi:hypothetical protein
MLLIQANKKNFMFIFILGPTRIIKLNSTKFVFKNYGVA